MRLAERQAAFLREVISAEASHDPRVEIYRQTLRSNWRRALAMAYPVCERLVGAAFLGECAERYGEAHPAHAGDLNAHGAGFAAFVAGYAHAAALPYLADVARLEWAVHRAAFAPDPVAFDADALAAVPAEGLASTRLAAQAGGALVESPYPIVSIWEANQPSRDGTFGGAWQPEAAVVLREGLQVRVLRAGREAPMLRRLLGGATLADSCTEDADAAALPRWVAAGLFAGIAP